MDYGETFKKIREDKGLKIVDLEQSHISRSLIGKFEKGQSRMSADRLDKLLADMGVSHDEFLFLGGNQADNYIYTMLRDMGFQSGKYDEQKQLDKMIARATNDLRHGRGGLQARFMRDFGLVVKIGMATGSHDDRSDKKELYQYQGVQQHVKPAVQFLKKAETWGRMELDLFTLFYIGMQPSDLLVLGRLAIQRAQVYATLRSEKKRLVNIIHTAFNGLMYVDQDGASEMLALEAQAIQASNEFIIDWSGERLRLRLDQGMLTMLQGQVAPGYDLAISVVPVYDMLGMHEMANFTRQIIEETKEAITSGERHKIPHTYSMLI